MDKIKYEKFKNLFIARYKVQQFSAFDRLVLTEGGLDNRFFDNLNCNNVDFQSVDDIMRNDKILSQDINFENQTFEKEEFDNHKGFLKELFSESFLNPSLKNTIDKLNVIGIIDKDFDE